ncbi:TPA: DUF2061 domain-containing protein [Neisseria meningitidis]|uniref:DUF2061 domain-containing protein n=5 Tax=Neisseria meningitidis TaxID=487 RepID=UPI00027C9434|nr:DUF2061 domain-containing protein [Neisseria meningitidis]EJU80375.1 membrane-like protein [Neisseria meningitidis NM3001]
MLKTLTFAALHFSTAFSVTYVLTGSIGVSGAVALVEPLINTVVFYSGLNLNQYGVASPCRTICTVCGFVALS